VYTEECSDLFMNPLNIRKTGTDLSLMPRCPHPPAENVWWIDLDISDMIDQTVATHLNSSAMSGIGRTYFRVHL